MNFYFNLIQERSGSDNLPSVHVFNTFFYPKVLKEGHKGVRRWTKQVDLFSKDIILIPVHLGVHWCLAVSLSGLQNLILNVCRFLKLVFISG